MKNKGFTLVELLAVIVILAVISIITIPLIGNVIEDSRKKALESSVNGIIEAANYFTITNDGIYEFLFDETKQGETINGKSLDYKGSIDAEGSLYIDKDGNISLCLMNEEYYVYKNYNSGIYIGNTKDNKCIVGYDVLTNKYVAMLDDGSGSISNVYTKEEVNTLVDGLEEKITINSTNIESLNTVISENQNKITTLETDVTTNTGDIVTIKENITNIQTSLSTYATKTELEATNSNIDDLVTLVNNNANNISNILNDHIVIKTINTSDILYTDGVTDWHHTRFSYRDREPIFSFGITVSEKLEDWSILLTINTDVSFLMYTTLFAVTTENSYPLYFNPSTGHIGIVGEGLPAGNYLIK